MRRIFQLAAGLIIIMATLTPLMELFDHWDGNVAPMNDTELNVAAWFVVAGIILTVSKLLRYIPVLGGLKRQPPTRLEAPQASRTEENYRPVPTGSPPLTPLRI